MPLAQSSRGSGTARGILAGLWRMPLWLPPWPKPSFGVKKAVWKPLVRAVFTALLGWHCSSPARERGRAGPFRCAPLAEGIPKLASGSAQAACGNGCHQWCPGQGAARGPPDSAALPTRTSGKRELNLLPAFSPGFSWEDEQSPFLIVCTKGTDCSVYKLCYRSQRPGVSRFAFPGRLLRG